MKKKNVDEPQDNMRWLLTYSDLITLLMIFFVVMYASSNVDIEKYKSLSVSLNNSMGNGKYSSSSDENGLLYTDSIPITDDDNIDFLNPNNNSSSNVNKESPLSAPTLDVLKTQVDQYSKDNGLSDDIKTSIDDRGLVISFKDSITFDSGKADIKPDFKTELIRVGKLLKGMDNYIRVEGNTDNVPINTYEYHSNWCLSADRAVNVLELLVSKCGIPANKISAVGYGESRPLVSNLTEKGREKNRRVDVVIVRKAADMEERR